MIQGEDPSAGPARGKGGGRKTERRLAAIFAADIAGYSALMGRAEEETYRRVGAELEWVNRYISQLRGRVFSLAGDGLMAEFPSTVDAVRCALRIQSESHRRHAKLEPAERILFRIGVNSGEILVQGDRIGGDAVNIAARLETLAEPGGVSMSAAVHEQVSRTVGAFYEPLGEQKLKNIRQPVIVYAIRAASCISWIGMPALPPRAVSGPATPREPDEYRPSLAVLPFRTLNPNQADAYFSEGIVDDIIRVLGGLRDLLVVSRSSTLGFARQSLDVRKVGQTLDVQYVLHGSVRRSGDLLRIAVELSNARSGDVIWADRFDGKLSELFNLQDLIAHRVTAAIAPQVRQLELDRALRKHPGSMTAYDLTLQALDVFYSMDRASMFRAIDLLDQALATDPDYAHAYSRLASIRMRIIGQGWSTQVDKDRALASDAARMAIDRDRNDALALAIYGHLQSYLLRNYEVANDYLERALAAGPSNAWAWTYSSLTRGYLGDNAAAIERAERAIRLSPVGPEAHWLEHYLSQAYYLGGQYEESVGWGRLSAAHSGANTSNLRSLIAGLVAMGDMEEARRIAGHLLMVVPNFSLLRYAQTTPLRGDVRDLFIARLRRAGVPD